MTIKVASCYFELSNLQTGRIHGHKEAKYPDAATTTLTLGIKVASCYFELGRVNR